MATGATYAAITETRLFGTADMRDRLLGHLRTLTQESYEKSFRGGCVYDSALALVSGGNDAVTVSGTSEATDGQGHLLDVAGSGYASALQFENTAAVEYEVGLHYAEVPNGVQVNPRTGMSEFIGYDEQVGESGTPDLVTDNGGTITFRVNSITEAGVSNAGRKVQVWKNIPGPNATTEAVAVEELTVTWTGSNNEITTAAALGQDTVSTTAADYTVVLMGPTVKRNTSIYDVDGYAFLGKVTGGGAGSPPSAYDITDQDVVDMSLSDLADITSRNATTDRLKVDVKSYTGDVGDPQIQVRNPAGTPVFTVDGDGNVTISGTTTQEDFVQVNASETITDNLTAGDDGATDSHKIKGTWWHTNNAETANYLYVDGSSGRIGINKLHNASWQLDISGNVRVDNTVRIESAEPLQEYSETDVAVDAGGLWRWRLAAGNVYLQENTAAGGDFSTSSAWLATDRANGAFEFGKHLWPLTDDTYDLGASGQEWRNAYIDGTAYVDVLSLSTAASEGVGTDLYPTANGTWDLGGSGREWQDLWIDGVAYLDTLNMSVAAGEGCATHFLPTGDNTLDLGSPSYQWANVYVVNLNVGQDINPAADITYDLGQPTIRWLNVYTQNVSGGADPLNLLGQVTFGATGSNGVASILKPSTNGTYTLGTSSSRWDTLYAEKTRLLFSDNTISNTCMYVERHSTTQTVQSLQVGRFYAQSDATIGNGFGGQFNYYLNSSAVGYFHWYRQGADDQCYLEFRLNSASDAADPQLTLQYDNVAKMRHLRPYLDGTYDLGSSGLEWQNLFVDGVAYVDTLLVSNVAGEGSYTLVPVSDGTQSLGSVSYRWSAVYSEYLKIQSTAPILDYRETDIAVDAGGLYRTHVSGGNWRLLENTAAGGDFSANKYWLAVERATGELTTAAHFRSRQNNTYDLGSVGVQWRNLYIDGIAYIDTLSLSTTGGEGCATSLVPDVTATRNLGSASYRWNNVYATMYNGYLDSDTGSSPALWIHRDASTLNNTRLSVARLNADCDAAIVDNFGGSVEYDIKGTTVAKMQWWRRDADDQCDLWWYLRDGSDANTAQLTLHWDNYMESRHHYPYVADSYDLGANGFEWRDLYVQRVKLVQQAPRLEFHEDAVAVDAGGFWRFVLDGGNFRFEENTAAAGDFSTSTWWILFNRTDSTIVAAESVLPQAHSSYNLGSPSYRWAYTYSVVGNFSRNSEIVTNYPLYAAHVASGGATLYEVGRFTATASTSNVDGFGGFHSFYNGANEVATMEWQRSGANDQCIMVFRLNDATNAMTPMLTLQYDNIIKARSIHPYATDAYDLGHTTRFWENTFSNQVYMDLSYILWVDSGNSRITWDTSDYLMYIRAENQWRFGIANATKVAIGVGAGWPALINIGGAGSGSVRSDMLHVHSPTALPTTAGSRHSVATIGGNANTNSDYLDVSLYRHTTGGGWANSSLRLARSVDDAVDVGGYIEFRSSTFRTKGSWHPATTATYNLGNSTLQWEAVYASVAIMQRNISTTAAVAGIFTHNGVTVTNQGLAVCTFAAETDATPANNFGGYNEFRSETGAVGRQFWLRDGASDQYDFFWQTHNGTSLTERMRFHWDGNIRFNGTVIPNANSSFNLGTTSLYWDTAYIDTIYLATDFWLQGETGNNAIVIGGTGNFWQWTGTQHEFLISSTAILDITSAGIVVNGDIDSNGNGVDDLGGSGNAWRRLWVNYIELGETDGQGFESHLKPGTDDAFDLGSSTRQWRHLWLDGTANIDRLTVGSSTVEGCDDLDPFADEVDDLGSATYAWDVAYIADIYSHQGLYSFDAYDDLALIEAYQPLAHAEPEVIERGGGSRSMQRADPSTLPWPMLGPRCPSRQTWYVSLSDSVSFLLGGIKQLYQKHKAEVAELHTEIDDIKARLEAIGA